MRIWTKRLHLSVIGFAIGACLAACPSAKPASVFEDAAGRFSYEVAADLIEAPTDGFYGMYRLERPRMAGYVVASDARTAGKGVATVFKMIGAAYGEMRLDGVSSYKEWRLLSFAPGEGGEWKAAATQFRGGTLYAVIVAGGADSSPDALPPPFMRILTSFRFTGRAGEIFAPKNSTEFEGYIGAVIAPTGGSPSVAAVRDGEVVERDAADLSEFEAHAGIHDIHASFLLLMFFTEHIGIGSIFEYAYLMGDAARSPLADRTVQPIFGAFGLYRF